MKTKKTNKIRGFDFRTSEERKNRTIADADSFGKRMRTRYIEAALDMFYKLSRSEKLERMQK